jgi:hypothetical protein
MTTQFADRAAVMVACLAAVLLLVYATPGRLAVGTMERVQLNTTTGEHDLVAIVVFLTRDTYVTQIIMFVYAFVLFCTSFYTVHYVAARHLLTPIAAAFSVLHVAITSNVCDATALAALFMLTYLTTHTALQSGDCLQASCHVLRRVLLLSVVSVYAIIIANIITAANILTYVSTVYLYFLAMYHWLDIK